jgi:hypothetical protein
MVMQFNYGVAMQLDLFTKEITRSSVDAAHIESWETCWGWDGPKVNGFCEVNTPIVEKADGGKIYCYMERCRLIDIRDDGKWLTEIEMPEINGKHWSKNGTKLILGITDIWPVTYNH